MRGIWHRAFGLVMWALPTFVTLLHAQETGSPPRLAAFSLARAAHGIRSGTGDPQDIYSVGFITRVWGIVVDDDGDLIVVGERDPSVPLMHLDDVAVALRTRDEVGGDDTPGVSIEPDVLHRYSPTQRVVYFGGVANTHYGMICFEADLFLKQLSLGLVSTNVPGLPSEWDLMLHNRKAGRRLDPWEQEVSRSWFFPLRVVINRGKGAATVTAATMEVRTDRDLPLMTPGGYVDLEPKAISDLLERDRDAAPAIFARLLTQHYDDIAREHPILTQLQNLLVLSGLLAEIVDDSIAAGLAYWQHDYTVRAVATPDEVPTVSLGVNGFGYSAFIGGGVFGEYEQGDAWTEAVLARRPKYLRQATLLARPSTDEASWIIPLQLGAPKRWTPDALDRTRGAEVDRLRSVAVDPVVPKRLVRRSASPHDGAWNPATAGRHLFAFRGNLHLSNGGEQHWSPDGRFSVTGSQLSAGLPITLQWVFHNKVEFALTVPILFKLQFEDRPTRLPGINDNLVAWVGGIDSPVLTNRIQVLSGVDDGRWRLPTLTLENSMVFPVSREFLSNTAEASGRLLEVPFGSDRVHGSHGVTTAIPVRWNLTFGASSEYQTDWRAPSFGDRVLARASVLWDVDRETGLTVGLHYATSWVTEQAGIGPTGTAQTLRRSQGQRYLTSLSFATGGGTNSFMLGLYRPNDPDLGVSFLFALSLDGTTFWDRRFWY